MLIPSALLRLFSNGINSITVLIFRNLRTENCAFYFLKPFSCVNISHG